MSEEKVEVAFVVAMACEAECIISNLQDRDESMLWGRRVVRGVWRGESAAVVVSGIGKDNAAAATQLVLSEFRPDEIINFGVAGGLKATMKVGEIYEVRAAIEYDFDLAELNQTAVGVLNERKEREIGIGAGAEGLGSLEVLGTGDRFSNDEGEAAALLEMGIGLRDMEGAAIAHVCETAGARMRCVKCVSDVHGVGEKMTGQYQANLAKCLEVLTRYWGE